MCPLPNQSPRPRECASRPTSTDQGGPHAPHSRGFLGPARTGGWTEAEEAAHEARPRAPQRRGPYYPTPHGQTYPPTRGPKQSTLAAGVSERPLRLGVRRPEVQDQGVSRAARVDAFALCPLVTLPCALAWSASPGVSSYRTPPQGIRAPPSWPYLTLVTRQSPVSKYSHTESQGFDVRTGGWGRGCNSVHSTRKGERLWGAAFSPRAQRSGRR